MTDHKTGTRDELLAACKELKDREEELGKVKSELAKARQELPWVVVKKKYDLDTDDGVKTLAELFDGRTQLLVYHIMFGPEWTAACPGCSALVDHLDPMLPHLNARDVTLICVSHAPLKKIQAFKRRMGWKLPYASSYERDFTYDFGASITPEQQPAVAKEVLPQFVGNQGIAEAAASCGITVEQYVTWEAPGLDAFALEPDGVVYHTFTSVPYGDLELGYEQYMARAPRAGDDMWPLHHDAYPVAGARARQAVRGDQ